LIFLFLPRRDSGRRLNRGVTTGNEKSAYGG